MPKHKLPRKSTHIDMTAMCDVAFLLLTFFMLATKFKPDEPVVVVTPSSVTESPIPPNSILLTLDKDGRIFFDFDNKAAKKDMINDMNTARKLGLTPDECDNFVRGSSVGSSLSQLKSFLSLTSADKGNFQFSGIPNDTTDATLDNNELVYWVQEARAFGTANSSDGKSPRICIKADSKTPYPKVRALINSLTKNEIDRFNLITAAEAVPEGTALWEERMKSVKTTNTETHN